MNEYATPIHEVLLYNDQPGFISDAHVNFV